MDTTPWDYWTDDDQPRAVTTEFLRVLEGVLKRDPGHVGANQIALDGVIVRPVKQYAVFAVAGHQIASTLTAATDHIV